MPPKRLPELPLIPDFLHLDWSDLIATLSASPNFNPTRTLIPPTELIFTRTSLTGLTVIEWQNLARSQPDKFQLIASLIQAVQDACNRESQNKAFTNLPLKKPKLNHKQRIVKMKTKTKKA